MDDIYKCKDCSPMTIERNDLQRWTTDIHTLIVIEEGNGQLEIAGKTYIVERGSILFCNPGRMIEVTAQSKLLLLILSFRVLVPRESAIEGLVYHENKESLRNDGEIQIDSFYKIMMLVKELKIIWGSEEGQYKQEMILYEILHLINRTPSVDTQELPKKAIELAISYIQKHYHEDITRDRLAELTHLHPRFFSTLFKRETGQTFSEYLARTRVKNAKELILLSGQKLDDIAHNVGYANGLYLSRRFKQIVGVSPIHYVRQVKRIVIYDWIGNLLALGIKPVGASFFEGLDQFVLLQDELNDVQDVSRTSIDSLETLKPELIIASEWLGPAMIHQLQKVAPTLVLNYGDPFEHFKTLANILDKRKEANKFLARYESKVLEIKEKLQTVIRPHETIAFYEIWDDGIWVINEFHGRGVYNLYQKLGIKSPLKIQKEVLDIGRPMKISIDSLPGYVADHMIFSFCKNNGGVEQTEKLLSSDLWKNLPAVKHNRVYWMNKEVMRPFDVLSLDKQLDIQLEVLLAQNETTSSM